MGDDPKRLPEAMAKRPYQHKVIKVRLVRSTPQIQLGEMGILEWNLTLPPQAKQEIYYQFTVEYPPELMVIGLDV